MADEVAKGPSPASEDEWAGMHPRWRLVLGPVEGQGEDALRLRGVLFSLMCACDGNREVGAAELIAIIDRFSRAEAADLLAVNDKAREQWRASARAANRIIVPPAGATLRLHKGGKGGGGA